MSRMRGRMSIPRLVFQKYRSSLYELNDLLTVHKTINMGILREIFITQILSKLVRNFDKGKVYPPSMSLMIDCMYT